MVFRWQIWFLISFLAVASWSLYNSMNSYGEGEELGKTNWEYAIKQDLPSLEAFCQKKGLTSTAKEPAVYSSAPFSDENPLFCSPTLEQAKASYGLFVQTQARKASIRLTFQFIGCWIAILLICFGVMKFINRNQKKKESN